MEGENSLAIFLLLKSKSPHIFKILPTRARPKYEWPTESLCCCNPSGFESYAQNSTQLHTSCAKDVVHTVLDRRKGRSSTAVAEDFRPTATATVAEV